MTIRLLVADDHQLMRHGLRVLLDGLDDMEVIGEACNGREVVEMSGRLNPDVVLIDIGMPHLNGIDATRQIQQLSNPPRVVALSMHTDRQFVQGVLRAGAHGYLLKDSAFEEVAQAVRSVSNGGTYLSPAIAGLVVEGLLKTSPDTESQTSVLSVREREVLQLISEGNSTKDVAQHLHISPKTVETHRRQIMNKLNLFSIAELTKYAIRHGLTRVD